MSSTSIGEMAEVAPARIDFRVPVVGELDQWRLILARPFDIGRRCEEHQGVAAFLVVDAARLDEAHELEKSDRGLEIRHADHRVQIFHGALLVRFASLRFWSIAPSLQWAQPRSSEAWRVPRDVSGIRIPDTSAVGSLRRAACSTRGNDMRTAYCFTPDRTFFPPAVRAIASLIEAEPEAEHEIFLVCEPDDVTPGLRQAAQRAPRAHQARHSRLLALRRQARRQRPLFPGGFSPPFSRRDPAGAHRADRHRRFRHADRPPGPVAARQASTLEASRSPPPTT